MKYYEVTLTHIDSFTTTGREQSLQREATLLRLLYYAHKPTIEAKPTVTHVNFQQNAQLVLMLLQCFIYKPQPPSGSYSI
jgi:hypothetical protein